MALPSNQEVSSKHAKHKLPRPCGAADLNALIFAQDPMPKCNCDICDPAFYKSIWNAIHPHAHVKLEKDVLPNRHGKECYRPLKAAKGPIKCELMHLARNTSAYFDKPEDELNNTQIDAVANFMKWRDQRLPDLLRDHPNANLDLLIPKKEARQLLRWTNELFFGRDSSRLHFHWTEHIKQHPDADGLAHRGWWRRYKISMRTWIVQRDPDKPEDRVMLELLSILLHEAIHTHIDMNGCREFVSAEWNAMEHGHGRAWRLLAAKVERCFVRMTGLPVHLARFDSIESHWDDFLHLPSAHDWKEWELVRELIVDVYENDLVDAYEQWSEPGTFDVAAFGEQWWAGDMWIEKKRQTGVDWWVVKKRGGGGVGCSWLKTEVEGVFEPVSIVGQKVVPAESAE